ncbi:aprataxin and PNK-like factor [Phymastichus coffea]|uniref:aprataxin and PNK-like factor n=1 Tax=Phymastichus coffea TaxID=108790 RepID=UPI00273CAC9D|nr:aprataxin and PNK-like factor [Phymastichus coffea]XP_058801886.1 aprataxin and PNK-like factor [Phymastichus coffea]XP_058801887.1 aprataxin and PNK-like factor [Phymastichus coffea]
MEPISESRSPKRELEQSAVNDSVNIRQCLESNGKLKFPEQIKQKCEELAMIQLDSNIKVIENNCETVSNSKPNVEVSQHTADDNHENHNNSDKKPDDEIGFNINSENAVIGEIEDPRNKHLTEVESSDLSALNPNAEKTEPDNTADRNQASVQNSDQASLPLTQIPFREKCKYGNTCYRLNTEHKDKFSHPGDTDYDDPDNRPECPYGILCYRKNPQHKLDYKHTATKRKRTQNPMGTTLLDGLSDFEDSMEESVDESEYDDSFIDDDDLDDDEFDSDLEFDDLDDENDYNSDDEDEKETKKRKKKNEAKEKKKKKTKNN